MDQKPKSMQSGSRNILRPNDSLSLWNYTLSPGWTLAESEMLRKAILKFGVGNWKDVLASGCLPGKTNAQINLQLQRMIGQQSTAEFQGIHLDPFVVGQENSKRQGVKRKNGCIVNTGNKMSRQELLERIQLNKKKYQVPESEWVDIVLEVVENDTAQDPMLEKRNRLLELKSQLVEIEKLIKERESELSSGSGSGSAMAKDTTSKDALPSDTINPIALSATSKPNETNLEDIDELEF